MRALMTILAALAIVAAVISPMLTTTPVVDAAVVNSVIASYLDRIGVDWKRNEKDANEFIVTKKSGLKRADVVEIYIYNNAKDDEIRLRAYPLANAKYLGLGRSGNQTGLMKAMLQKNTTAFGAYFVDNEGDIGFKYVFTTESGVGYEAFKVVVNELLRIADDAVVALYNEYR